MPPPEWVWIAVAPVRVPGPRGSDTTMAERNPDDDLIREEEAAAAADARRIGGVAGDKDDFDPEMRPVYEAGEPGDANTPRERERSTAQAALKRQIHRRIDDRSRPLEHRERLRRADVQSLQA